MEDYAARYGGPDAPGGGGPSNATRYVIEGHVRDASPPEWEWAYEYLCTHLSLLEGPAKTDAQLRQDATQSREVASDLARFARQCYDNGEYSRARELIDQAEDLDPASTGRWNRIREIIHAAEPPTPAPLPEAEPESAQAIPAPPGRARHPDDAPSASTEESSEEPAPPTPTTPPAGEAVAFRPDAANPLVPSGAVARMRANLQALRVVRELRRNPRPATPAEQSVLAGWSGWGAVPQALDENYPRFAWAREALRELLDPDEFEAAALNTLNAHYTDPALIAPIWDAVRQLGFDSGRVLEPGCGSGNFIGMAPAGAEMVGVELEPVTAAIARALYPQTQILTESFADTKAPAGSFDLVVGNVPFAKVALSDPQHNRGHHSIHNHFIIKSLNLVAPGGLVAVLTSRYTLDSANPAARREMAALADLVGAIRLPSSAHQRTAGTTVVTDLLVLRRREPDFEPTPNDWELTELTELPHRGTDQEGPGEQAEVRVNSYFLRHPEMVCGQLAVGRGQFSDTELTVHTASPAARLLADKLAVLVTRATDAELTHRPSALLAPARRAALVGRAADLSDDHLAVRGEEFTQLVEGTTIPFEVPSTQRGEAARAAGVA